jgi:hypothetical protein
MIPSSPKGVGADPCSFRKLACGKLPLQFHPLALIFYKRNSRGIVMQEKVIIFGKDL